MIWPDWFLGFKSPNLTVACLVPMCCSVLATRRRRQMTDVHMQGKVRRSEGPHEIWHTRSPLPSASGVAQRLGFLQRRFAARGIKIESVRALEKEEIRSTHYTHLHPALFREGGPVAPLWARSIGRDTALVGISRIDEVHAILVRAESDIVTISDLQRRKLSLPCHKTRYADHARAHTLFGYTSFLQYAGLTLSDVELIDVEHEEYEVREPAVADRDVRSPLANALLAGRVDAIYATGPRVPRLMDRYGLRPVGDRAVLGISDETIRLGTPRAVTVSGELVRKFPEIVCEYLLVLLETARWAERNPHDAQEVLCADLQLTTNELLAAYGSNVHRQLFVRLTSDSRMALKEQKAFLMQHGFLGGDFDFDSWVDPRPLKMAEEAIREGEQRIAV
jgi:ABC-type nitrate/sulfonate/bicarbonate transport system substrate-binding protein